MVGKIAIIIFLTVGADLCLEEHDDVSIFGVGNGTQEDGGAGACVKVIIILGL